MNNHQKLADLIVNYIKARHEKKLISLYKDKPQKNKQGRVTNGAFNIRLATLVGSIAPDKKEDIKTIENSKKDKDQAPLKFQQKKYNQLLDLAPQPITNSELLALEAEVHKILNGLAKEHTPTIWLSTYSAKASDISFATHVAKLTHSSSKGSSILDLTNNTNTQYLTTNCLNNPEIDTASSNAASLPIADILKLSVEGISVLDCIQSNDTTFLNYLTKNEELIEVWIANLKQAYDSDQKSSYFLNKQVYFPVEQGYHLLLPLTSSSLVHAIYKEHQKYYSEEATEARRQKKSGLYSPLEVRSYPNKAYLNVTGSNHSNASSLNGQRGGRMPLFASMPPQWQSNNINITNKSTLFDNQLEYRLRDDIHSLRKYLIVLKQQQAENLNKPQRNAAVVRKLKSISDAFFEYLTEIQLQNNTAGWTMDCELSLEQQLLLEPNRTDDIAKTEKLAKMWIKTVSASYARWLNKQLKHNPKKTNQQKKILLNLTPIHERLWQEHFTYELNNYLATITNERLEENNL